MSTATNPDAVNAEEPPTIEWSQAWTLDEKLDFIYAHVRLFPALIDMLTEIGQKVTNVDQFCADTAQALAEMQRKNPMARLMMPPGVPSFGGIRD